MVAPARHPWRSGVLLPRYVVMHGPHFRPPRHGPIPLGLSGMQGRGALWT